MASTPTQRQARDELAYRLMTDFAGAVPAGQVLAAVLRADRLLSSYHAATADRTTLCEQLVRRRLQDLAGRAPRSGLELGAS